MSTRSVATAASITSATKPTSTSPTVRCAHVSPGSFADAEGHTISLYSLSKTYGMAGWRIGYMVYPEAAGRRHGESPGHGADLPAGHLAGDGGRGHGRRSGVLPAARRGARRGARRRARRASIARTALHGPASRRRLLLLFAREREGGSDARGRTADSRTQGGGHSRHGVRPDGRLLFPRGVRRAREGDGRRRHRPAGRPACAQILKS